MVCWLRTGWLLPGSLTVVNCVSLYFLNAGLRESTSFGSSNVRALMSVMGARERLSGVFPIHQVSMSLVGRVVIGVPAITLDNYERISSLLDMRRWSIVTSPGGAASTKEETTSDLDMTGG